MWTKRINRRHGRIDIHYTDLHFHCFAVYGWLKLSCIVAAIRSLSLTHLNLRQQVQYRID